MTKTFLFIALIVLIVVSAFFSGSETSMMALNRYRLRHLARKQHRGAKRAQKLLRRPDRLLGIILIGNTFANILASSVATILAVHWFGDAGIAIATVLLTFVILVFAEVMPKTFGAFFPEKYAFPASMALDILLKMLYPIVWVMNAIANTLLRPLGINPNMHRADALSAEELRSIVSESRQKLTGRHHNMLLGVLDLEKASVADCMIPRKEIFGINLNESWDTILHQLADSPYSKLPIYQDNIDNTVGMLHLRKVIKLLEQGDANKETLVSLVSKAYFIPETTSLQKQLLNFQRNAEDIGLVVDEYGDIVGLVTVEDVVEEVVGEFTSAEQPAASDFTQKQADGSYLVDGAMTIRDINRDLQIELPINGPKTLNGLITETLESIPTAKTCVLIAQYPIEILQVKAKKVKRAKIYPEKVRARE